MLGDVGGARRARPLCRRAASPCDRGASRGAATATLVDVDPAAARANVASPTSRAAPRSGFYDAVGFRAPGAPFDLILAIRRIDSLPVLPRPGPTRALACAPAARSSSRASVATRSRLDSSRGVSGRYGEALPRIYRP